MIAGGWGREGCSFFYAWPLFVWFKRMLVFWSLLTFCGADCVTDALAKDEANIELDELAKVLAVLELMLSFLWLL